MATAARDLDVIPGRDEATLAADVLYRLIERRVLKGDKATVRNACAALGKGDKATVRNACAALGISVEDARQASIRFESRGWRSLRPTMVRPTPVPDTPTEPSVTAASGTRPRRATGGRPATTRTDETGTTTPWCGRHNGGEGAHVPISEFAVKSHATGTLKSYCRPCMVEYQRDRYLTVEKAAAVDVAYRIAFALTAGDVAVGEPCPNCGTTFCEGDHVEGEMTVVHVECPTGG